jgi:hypothetical protein
MRSIYSVLAVFVVLSMIAALPAFARIPVRQSSDNGIDSSANAWKLTGRTDAQPYTANGKKALIVRESICPNQDRSTGYCRAKSGDGSGDYMFLFQLQSIQLQPTDSGISVQIGRLSGFVPNDADQTYGVMVCPVFDPTLPPNSNNTLELCTTDPGDPTFQNLPDISFTHNASNTTVTFTIPRFSPFPAGKVEQGVGITLFVKTHQAAYRPMAYPTVGIH